VITGLGMLDEKPWANTEQISVNESMVAANRMLDETAFQKQNVDIIYSQSEKSDSQKLTSNKKGDADVCRICLGTEEEGTPGEDGEPDKLICPCKCAGSMGLIHISCLKEWVNSKRLVYKGKKVQSFFWKALECELCQEPFENRMKYMMF